MTTIQSLFSEAAKQSSENTTQSTTTKSTDGTLGYDAFLQLLLAQMQNQDPMEPMNSSDYVAQLATFSQVEKTIELKDRVADLLSTVRMQQAEGLIGKTISSSDGTISGIVGSAKVVGNDVIAVLKDGTEVTMTPGILISETST